MATKWQYAGMWMTYSLGMLTLPLSPPFFHGLLPGMTLPIKTQRHKGSMPWLFRNEYWLLWPRVRHVRHDPIHLQNTNVFPITGVSSTPAADHLFNVCPQHGSSFLPEEQAHSFHHTTAQLLFLSRVQRDIQPTIAFLTTRVKQPDEDDWGKLKKKSQISQFHSQIVPHTFCRLSHLSPLVCWCIPSNTWWLQGSYRVYSHIWQGCNNKLID